jgi:uncharacterized membrane protein
MKKILLSVMLLISVTAYSQNFVEKTLNSLSETADSLKKDVSDGIAAVDTGSLYKTIYKDAKQGLKGLADALKVGVEHVYKVLVMQQVVKSIIYIVVGIISLIFAYAFSKQLTLFRTDYSEWKNKSGRSSYDEYFSTYLLLTILFGVFSLIAMGVCIFHIDVIVTGIVNPEFGAMQQIMEWVNPDTKR